VVSAGTAGIVAALSRDSSPGLGAVAAELCADVLGLTGVAVSVLVSGDGDMIWRTDGASARLEDLQFTLGQGPGVDAAASGELLLEADLEACPRNAGRPSRQARWSWECGRCSPCRYRSASSG
jgi:hypothetical protein